MRSKPRRGDLVVVTWRDIVTLSGGETTEAQLTCATFKSYGVFLSQDTDCLKISHDIDLDSNESRGGSVYPTGCILKIRLVEEDAAKGDLK